MRPFAAALCAVLLAFASAACETLSQEEPQKDQSSQRGLTAGDIARMSPEELDAYYRSQEQERRRTQSKSLVDSFNETKYSTRKRKKLQDVSHPVLLDSNESVFPWRTGNRSEKLHESMNLSGR